MLSAVKSLPGTAPRPSEDFARTVRHPAKVIPSPLPATTAVPSTTDATRNDARIPAVALVLIIDSSANATHALERDLGAQAVEIDPLNLEEVLPQNAQAAVQRILTALKTRLNGGSSVTAIPVDLNLSLRTNLALPALEFEAMRIDRARRVVHTNAGLIPLTKGEFDLLAFLAENPEVAFSRRELVDACRGGDHFLDYRAIDVQIFGLRKKLGAARWHVQTVRGFGYRFVTEQPEHAVINLRPR